MTKRLQVLVEEDELREIRKVARARRMTVAEWVRTAMRDARRREPRAPVERKLAVVRAAAKHELPTADIDQMLSEIERGYVFEADS
ncbi:MAG TPA: antitoxin [Thermoanaerobaculia bacterium]|nr:antitoxin [Thermoanaerobaculia bacterium]